ncbi:CGNR zinc finger domain-containing protein [Sinomicrobium weinanense]|uniref:CGNR zinc finger domain-containing protein n=1 Tax=Sinomicrobium weinanense TaxID=2842200 RepID=A0A926JNZ2_9FLAO|nr:ABATE domain-containing protein [Sinomicrobium weinanense]MBC9794689.1 CGNR zinc finger domain-containing protein [Sinomicrobium weinanense]MBU3124174.1 CGNR zinc finger domain-containing protein [Sinomicrobium weinanense]
MKKKEKNLNPGNYGGTYKVIGGNLCFDFVNTISWRDTDLPHEWLDSLDNLLIWTQLVKVFDEDQVKKLKTEILNMPNGEEKYLTDLIELRELLNRIFVAIIDAKSPSEKDLKIFNQHVSNAYTKNMIVENKLKFHLEISEKVDLSQRLTDKIVLSAVEVLTQVKLKRIKKCFSCHWLYEDVSRNNSRRWCVMEDCGNRYKVNQFNKRRKSENKGSE